MSDPNATVKVDWLPSFDTDPSLISQRVESFFQATTLSPTVAEFFDTPDFNSLSTFMYSNVTKAEYYIDKNSPGGLRVLASNLGVDWVAIGQIINDILLNPGTIPLSCKGLGPGIQGLFSQLPNFTENFKEKGREALLNTHKIPIRSGYLVDHLCSTLDITPNSWYRINIMQHITALYPPLYPYPIEGRVQHSEEEGWGPEYDPIFPVRRYLLYGTGGAGAMYMLNDPEAEPDYLTDVNRFLADVFIDVYSAYFQDLILIMQVVLLSWATGINP